MSEDTQALPPMDHEDDSQPPIPMDEQSVAQRASRKREREASIEPQTPKSDSEEQLAEAREWKTRAAKKNRLQPVEELLESPPRSPPLNHSKSPSPTNDTQDDHKPPERKPKEGNKVQSIRKRVRNLSWKDQGSPRPKSIYDTTMHEAEDEPDEGDSHSPIDADETQDLPSNEDVNIASPNANHQQPEAANATTATVPTQASEPTTPRNEIHAEDIHLPDQSPATPPVMKPDATDPPMPPPERASTPTPTTTKAIPISIPGNASTSNHQRKTSDSDLSDAEAVSKSPSRKRKLITRESTFANESETHHEQYSKRSKDTGEPSEPPLLEDVGSPPKKRNITPPNPTTPPASPPKSAGFAAFSGASPFTSVLGNAFGSSSITPVAPQPRSFGSGFGSFMSMASPFAAVASASSSLFGSKAPPPPPPVARTQTPEANKPSGSLPTPPSRSRSPSLSSLNRRKSPPPPGSRVKPGAAFGTYNNSSFGFGAAGKRHSPSASMDALSRKETLVETNLESEPPSQLSETAKMKETPSWGEMLGTGAEEHDDDDKENKKMIVEEVEVTTGEEDEDTRHQVRAKLYQLDPSGAYKEKGTGTVKLNVRKADTSSARLVMRADAVLRLLLNAALFRGMAVSLGQDPKWVKITSLEEGKPVHYAMKTGGANAAQAFLQAIQDHIPSADEKNVSASAAATESRAGDV